MTEEFDNIVRGFYDGIFTPGGWRDSLSKLRDITASAQATVVCWQPEIDDVAINENVGFDRDFTARYETHYHRYDPTKALIQGTPEGGWYLDMRDADPGILARSPLYQELLREYDLGTLMVSPVSLGTVPQVYLSFQRSARAGGYTEEDARLVTPLLAHIRSAARLRVRAISLLHAADFAQRTLDHLTFGVAVVSQNFNVLLSNRLAEPWLARFGPPTRWHARNPLLGRPLGEMIRCACDPLRPLPALATVADAPDLPPVQLLVLPLSPDHRFAADWQIPAALLIWCAAAGQPGLLSTVLRELYDMTPAEIRLAESLSSGKNLADVCEMLGIRHETGRTQLKSVFLKTGTGSQAQLARLLAQLVTVGPVDGLP